VKVLCLSDSDTRMKWTTTVAAAIGSSFARHGVAHGDQFVVDVASFEGGAVPTSRQLDEIGVIGPHLLVSDQQLNELVQAGYDVLIVNTVGSRLHRVTEVLRSLSATAPRRPLLVTGYAGVVYEKHVEGAVWRAGADVICCNSAVDHALFSGIYRSLGVPVDGLVRAGLGVVHRRNGTPVEDFPEHGHGSARPNEVRTLTFAVQPDVPRGRNDRLYLLERLAAYARAHPSRSVIVKLRSRPEEATTHRERFHFEELYRTRLVDRPPNLSFEYGLMSRVLERTDLLVTISSTAALEAIALGVPVAVLADLGVGEGLGNHFFLGSGLLSSMNLITQDKLPVVDPEWLRMNGFGGDDRLENVAARILELHELQAAGDRALPVPDGFVNDEMTPRLAALSVEPLTVLDAGTLRARRVRRWAVEHLPRPVIDLGIRAERRVGSWR